MVVDVDPRADIGADLGALRVVADPVRWRILELLGREELCVCHLVEELDLAQSLVSHHLRALRDAGLVDTTKHRYWTYYRVRSDELTRLADTVAGLAGTGEPREPARRPCC